MREEELTFEELAGCAKEFVVEQITQDYIEFPLSAWIWKEGHETAMIPIEPFVPRPAVKRFLRMLLSEVGADGYVVISEAWAAKRTEDNPLPAGVAVNELPEEERQEILIACAVLNGQKPVVWYAEIKQGVGAERTVGSWEMLDKGENYLITFPVVWGGQDVGR